MSWIKILKIYKNLKGLFISGKYRLFKVGEKYYRMKGLLNYQFSKEALKNIQELIIDETFKNGYNRNNLNQNISISIQITCTRSNTRNFW